MRRSVLVALLACASVSAEMIRFDHSVPGRVPAGWSIAMTHEGAPPQWEIVSDPSAPSPHYVLAQLSRDPTAGRFPLAIWDAAVIRDGEVSVAFKTVDGVVDQAAGIVWRYRDPGNYYIARANSLESNVVLYKVEGGVRTSIAPKGLPSRSYGVKRQIPRGQWNTLRVVFQDNVFTVFLNGDKLFDAEDRTFSQSGKTGLWTKADSLTYFDQFSIQGK